MSLRPVGMRVGLVLMGLCSLMVLAGCVAQRADDMLRQRQQERLNQALATTRAQIPEAKELTGSDLSFVERGRSLFNGKALCQACHGKDAYQNQVRDAEVAKFKPAPTDLRVPLQKSVRELFLTIKYGVAGTGMVPVQEDAGLSDEELAAVLAYVLALQGQPTTLTNTLRGMRDYSPGADLAIRRLCSTDDNLSAKSIDRCAEPFRKRFRVLITGRPADIPSEQYAVIQSSCTGLADLTQQSECYRDRIGRIRVARFPGITASMATPTVQVAETTTSAPAPTPSAATENVEEVIKTKCAAQWPEDFRMQAHCIEQQQQAARLLTNTSDLPTAVSTPSTGVRTKCAADWPDDFRMRAHCEQQQMKGLEALTQPRPEDISEDDYSILFLHCEKQWATDYRMRAHCMSQQMEAVRKLRRR